MAAETPLCFRLTTWLITRDDQNSSPFLLLFSYETLRKHRALPSLLEAYVSPSSPGGRGDREISLKFFSHGHTLFLFPTPIYTYYSILGFSRAWYFISLGKSWSCNNPRGCGFWFASQLDYSQKYSPIQLHPPSSYNSSNPAPPSSHSS